METFTVPKEVIDAANEYHETNYAQGKSGRPPNWFRELKSDWAAFEALRSGKINPSQFWTSFQQGGNFGRGSGSDGVHNPRYTERLFQELGVGKLLGVEIKEGDALGEILDTAILNLMRKPKILVIIAAVGYLEWKTKIISVILNLLSSVTLLIQGTESFIKGAAKAADDIIDFSDQHLQNTGTPLDEIPSYVPGLVIIKAGLSGLKNLGLW